uniref:NADH dehydrogenase [ubiquinone] flavoprotein 3, mitochondrial n=1 Tax=Erpetoichthys calabaricus TaxID=27687 RepID=A0A8C4RND8_ERPCA
MALTGFLTILRALANKRCHFAWLFSTFIMANTVQHPKSKEMDFDISTYKNLQHHDYSTYTFVDFDLELAKFRLPQPLSGRK